MFCTIIKSKIKNVAYCGIRVLREKNADRIEYQKEKRRAL